MKQFEKLKPKIYEIAHHYQHEQRECTQYNTSHNERVQSMKNATAQLAFLPAPL